MKDKEEIMSGILEILKEADKQQTTACVMFIHTDGTITTNFVGNTLDAYGLVGYMTRSITSAVNDRIGNAK